MTFTVAESPWVFIKKDDPSFKLQGPFTVADRAFIQINSKCPRAIVNDINVALEQGWIEAVATVPKDDPTLIWDTIKQ
jgi:hypothetical protein